VGTPPVHPPMSARYAPLPNPRSVPDTNRELDDAFGEDDDLTETTPFTAANPPSITVNVTQRGLVTTNTPLPGAYDFEREYTYDIPPPGSPPRPTAFALPNDIGNSNGFLPSSPIRIPLPRISLFRRAVGAILPTHYTRVPSEPTHPRVIGGGLDNDGVFANVTAKPQRGREVHSEDGNIYVVPEEAQKDVPPVRISSPQFSLPISLTDACIPVIRCRSTGRCTTLLGDDSPRPFGVGSRRRHDHRRSSIRFNLDVRP
jgi:hypothetical protein